MKMDKSGATTLGLIGRTNYKDGATSWIKLEKWIKVDLKGLKGGYNNLLAEIMFV